MALTDVKAFQSEEILPAESERDDNHCGDSFADNVEHLEALEYLSRLRLGRAYLLAGISPHASPTPRYAVPVHMKKRKDRIGQPDLCFLDLSGEEISPNDLDELIEKGEKDLSWMVKNSLAKGLHLNFEDFCSSHGLNSLEGIVLSLLLANNTSKAFRDFYEKSLIDPHDRQDGGMSIGAILSIISPDYREQIKNRKHFSIDAALMRHEILVPWGRYDEATNILDVYVYLHERILRYLLGDNNIYDTGFQCISRESNLVDLDQVILPGRIKEDVLRLAESYSKNRAKKTKALLDRFYGYGTGLVFLFYGLSGTGKTMLAHALATRLDKELLSVNMENASNVGASSEDLIKYLFREAKLNDGIVFFDECDEVFQVNSRESRTILIELEKSDCITIMATNRVVELDPALDRRISMKVPFTLPDESQREKIWQALVPPEVSLNEDMDFRSLAEKYVFTGGLIKNTIFTALTNIISKNGNSELMLSADEIEEAAEWQTASMFDLCAFGETYIPQISIEELPLRPQDKKRAEDLAKFCTHLNGQSSNLRVLVGCSDIETGIQVADAVARKCDFRIRKFHLSDLIKPVSSSSKATDPMTNKDIDLMDHAFKPIFGRRALTVLVDYESWFERLLIEETDSGERKKDLVGFYRRLRESDAIIFLVTTPIRTHLLPFEFRHYFEAQLPSEELQLRKWEEHFGEDENIRRKLVNLVESHPLHLNQISQVIEAAKSTAIYKGNENLTMADVDDAIRRLKNLKKVPILFGQEDHRKPAS